MQKLSVKTRPSPDIFLVSFLFNPDLIIDIIYSVRDKVIHKSRQNRPYLACNETAGSMLSFEVGVLGFDEFRFGEFRYGVWTLE